MRVLAFSLAVAIVLAASAAKAADPVAIRFCAPGYPGTTDQAAPTMQAFARALERAGGLADGAVEATYHETEDGAVDALSAGQGGLAVVTLPFWLRHREALRLEPVALSLPVSGANERWSLVAMRGRVSKPADLEGWEIDSIAGYAPAFVRGPALEDWGELPATASIVFSPRVLGALRRVSKGEDVAVLLDGGQTAGLDRLPFARELETVTESDPMPASIVCAVGGAPAAERLAGIVDALRRLDDRETLDSLRLQGFGPLPPESLDEIVRSYERASGGS